MKRFLRAFIRGGAIGVTAGATMQMMSCCPNTPIVVVIAITFGVAVALEWAFNLGDEP